MFIPFHVGLVVGLLSLSLFCPALPILAQVKGDDAELGRLRSKAEDAMANDDPDGAAQLMGRAALLAAQMARRQEGYSAQVNKGNEALFRSQEHTYRAMALFRRAGGQLPASSGVCGSLALAHTSLGHAFELDPPPSTLPPASRLIEDAKQLRDSAENWNAVIESMIAEYQCP
ncbi:MAG TPA: hypothetical protein VLE03_06465 [Nitrospiraceae bacterium]|nr:hypothetical protein [Nitrospiraceae bacterium]